MDGEHTQLTYTDNRDGLQIFDNVMYNLINQVCGHIFCPMANIIRHDNIFQASYIAILLNNYM